MIRKLLVNSFKAISNEIFFYIPFTLLAYLGIAYTGKILSDPYSEEQYKLLIGLIGTTATIAGLALRASSIAEDQDKRNVFYNSGERLFHATILFSLATLMKYVILQIKPSGHLFTVLDVVKIMLSCSSSLYFFYGLVYCSKALSILHRTLFKGNEKPLG